MASENNSVSKHEDLVKAARLVEPEKLKEAKIVLRVFGISDELLEKDSASNVCGLIELVKENAIPDNDDARTFIFHIFEKLGHRLQELPEESLKRIYDLEKYERMDMCLTVIKFVKELEDIDYDLLRDYVADQLKVAPGSIEDRNDLIGYVFNEGDLSQPNSLYEVATVFDCQSLFSDYCTRHRMEKPVVPLPPKGNKCLRKIYYRRQLRSSKKKSTCCSRVVCGLVVIFMALLVVGTGVTVVVAYRHNFMKKEGGSVNVSDSSVVNVKNSGFMDDLDFVEVSLVNSEDRNIEVNVYKERCDDIPKSNNVLPPSYILQLDSDFFKRQPYNYQKEDNPLYGLEGSFLIFNISANSTISNPGCPNISIFNDYNYYFDATNPGETNDTAHLDGVIDSSRCLTVSTSGPPANSSWIFRFNRPQYIYATIDVGKMVQIDGSISGHLMSYSVSSLSPVCEGLTMQSRSSRTCKVEICGQTCTKRGSPTQCLFVQVQPTDDNDLGQIEVAYTEVSPMKDEGFFTSLGVSLSLILISLLFVIIVCICLCVLRCIVYHQKLSCI